MGFPLLPRVVTLNDLERPLFCIISPNSVALGANYVTVVEAIDP